MNINIPAKLSIPEKRNRLRNCYLLIAVSHYNLNADYDHEKQTNQWHSANNKETSEEVEII